MEEFIRALGVEVGHIFPLRKGEKLEEFCARAVASQLGSSQRAMIAAHIVRVSERFSALRREKKTAWIAAARLTFSPGARRPCAICKKYDGLTEAHHIVPLALQFDAGAEEPIQEFDWLCPTHHAAEHVCISNLVKNVSRSIAGMPPAEADSLATFGVRFVELFTALPRWTQVRNGKPQYSGRSNLHRARSPKRSKRAAS